MKNLLLVSVLICSSFFCFGQLKDFDLKDQVLSDYRFEALEISPSFRIGSHYSSHFFMDDKNTVRSGFFSPDFDVEYQRVINNRKVQWNQRASGGFFLNYNFINYNSPQFKNKQKIISTSLDLEHSSNKLFYKGNNLFYGFGHQESYTFLYSENTGQVTQKEHFVSLKLPLSVGKGRIENIGDSWRAVRILQDLKRLGLLTREPTVEEINRVAILNTTRKNWRFFDGRLKGIEDIQLLADELLENGLIENENAFFYTSLNDMWRYGATARNSGKRLKFEISPNTNYSVKAVNGMDETLWQGRMQYELEYLQAEPINLEWQLDWTVGISADLYSRDLDSFKINRVLRITPNANANMGYYPNTRTSIRFSGGVEYQFRDIYENTRNFNDNLNFVLGNSTYYYLTPATRIVLSSSFSTNFAAKGFNCRGGASFANEFYSDAFCSGFGFSFRVNHFFF